MMIKNNVHLPEIVHFLNMYLVFLIAMISSHFPLIPAISLPLGITSKGLYFCIVRPDRMPYAQWRVIHFKTIEL